MRNYVPMRHTCGYCGISFLGSQKFKVYCSDECIKLGSRRKAQERMREYNKAHYQRNKKYFHDKWVEYYAKNKQALKERSRKWYSKMKSENYQKLREQDSVRSKRYKEKVRHGNNKEELLKKFGHKCYFCSATQKLVVHHADEQSYWDGGKANNSIENLVIFCQSCHQKFHWITNRLIKTRMKRKSDTPSNRR